MEPPNKGHIGTRNFSLYKEVSFIQRLSIIGIGTSSFVLYREVSFIRVSFIRCSTVLEARMIILLQDVGMREFLK